MYNWDGYECEYEMNEINEVLHIKLKLSSFIYDYTWWKK